MQSQCERQIKPPPEHYTVAIICSLGCQLVAIRHMFDTPFETPRIDQSYDHNDYTCGCINGHYVVVASKGLFQTGVVNASVQIGHLKHSFRQLKSTIVLGTAGGIPSQPPKSDPMEDIRLGDVVVGWAGPSRQSLVQWDSGTHESDGIKVISIFNLPSQKLINGLGKLHASRENHGDAMFRKISKDVLLANLQISIDPNRKATCYSFHNTFTLWKIPAVKNVMLRRGLIDQSVQTQRRLKFILGRSQVEAVS